MRLRTISYLTGEAVSNVRDNGLLSVAAVSTVAISLLVLAIVALLALNLQYVAAVVDGQVQIVAYLESGAPAGAPGSASGPAAAGTSPTAKAPAAAKTGASGPPSSSASASTGTSAASSKTSAASGSSQTSPSPAAPPSVPQIETVILQEIQALPGVSRAVLIPKAEALSDLQQEMGGDGDLVSEFQNQNPLPDSVNVYVDDPRDVASVAAALQQIDGVGSIKNGQSEADKLAAFTRAVRILGIFLVAALALATIVVIGNTVRVAVWARRDQIGIMKLVGATDGFIRLPFFLEGAILGLGGALISAGIVAWGYTWVHGVVARSLAFLPLMTPWSLLPGLLEALLAGGVLLGALGSAISVRRHLSV